VKLILSLWNQSNAFSLRECVDNLDGERIQLALRVAIHFANYGEDRELVEIGYQASERYPRLWSLAKPPGTLNARSRSNGVTLGLSSPADEQRLQNHAAFN
jgi:hypothetical protein